MAEAKVTVFIDGRKVEVPADITVLQAARIAGVDIPTLCFMEGLSPYGSCRICVVEIEGISKLVPSCSRKVEDGMRITTNSKRIRNARRMIVEMLLSDHMLDCPTCEKNKDCELLELAYKLGVHKVSLPLSKETAKPKDTTSLSLERDPNKCILCGRCVRVCEEWQKVHAIDFVGRGKDMRVAAWFDRGLGNVMCTNCGQCLQVCPVGAIYEKSTIDLVWDAIEDEEKFVIVQEAPAVRVGLAEALGLPAGTVVTGKMYAALWRLGFDAVCDTNFAADLTIIEEATEFISRLKNGGPLPLITSCCPGWIKFMEDNYPDFMENVSTCKSPQQMFGALAKTYYPERKGIDPSKVISVSVMPCTAKKFECARPEMRDSGWQDVDFVLTTRELARMIREAGIVFEELPEEEADPLLGYYTGAGTIFGATGGVMEAALRTAYYYVTGKELENINLTAVRGMEGVREAEVNVDGTIVKVAVAHGLGNARKVLDAVRNGEKEYHFIEIMACPGGCVGGGGQPAEFSLLIRAQRAKGLYYDDVNAPLRCSHLNPRIKELYDTYLGEPNGHKAHKLLHTHYVRREY